MNSDAADFDDVIAAVRRANACAAAKRGDTSSTSNDVYAQLGPDALALLTDAADPPLASSVAARSLEREAREALRPIVHFHFSTTRPALALLFFGNCIRIILLNNFPIQLSH